MELRLNLSMDTNTGNLLVLMRILKCTLELVRGWHVCHQFAVVLKGAACRSAEACHVQVALASCNAAGVASIPNCCHAVCTAWQGTAAQVLVGESA